MVVGAKTEDLSDKTLLGLHVDQWQLLRWWPVQAVVACGSKVLFFLTCKVLLHFSESQSRPWLMFLTIHRSGPPLRGAGPVNWCVLH